MLFNGGVLVRSLAVVLALGMSLALTMPASGQGGPLRGRVTIDGSSTVYPLTDAVAEEFFKTAPRVQVPVGVSGTGGGMKRFVRGETDISNASRPINAEEVAAAREYGIEFIELPVAFDGLTIVVNPENTWATTLTVDEVRKIYRADIAARTWADVREGWPDEPIQVFSPGTDSGTFDYFKEVVAGKDGAIRADMSVSEDDNVLVRGVSGNKNAIGFFGIAYYMQNRDRLRSVGIDGGSGPVKPTSETVESGQYSPFSRPLFIYVNAASLERNEVRGFVEFYLKNAGTLAEEVGYVRLPQQAYERAMTNLRNRRLGTQYLDENMQKVHGPLMSVYKAE
ncbi:MAG: PstS family phosphate ABC transporter substrate-binding protein [Phycisphaerales bacterium]